MDEHEHHHHGHAHGHNHPHDPIEVPDGAGHYELMVHAIKELLLEKGVVSADDIRKTLEFMDTRTPALGAKVVARAWTDPAFKARLLADGTKAVGELGIGMGDAELIVVENTAEVHNVIVCTLCSCYPRTVLGLPPDWYKSRNYRSRVVAEPRAVLQEFGTSLPDDVTLKVHDSNADMRYLVLPMRPAGTEGWSEERLAALVTRDCMVGVTVPKAG
ncbi:MAG TPA: nitrile hydratase subunit alpha [Stellaceae bacterium]|nr:nitrile hydratase subunit alpha [Stellaceae bacterium]